jgi:hypothetical protein
MNRIERMTWHRAAWLLWASAIPCIAMAAGDGHGQSRAERAQAVPAGPWQGNWRVTRDDPRIRTRGGAELARLHAMQDEGSSIVHLQWIAGPAICEDPTAEPCEWVGAKGETDRGRATGTSGLIAPLAVSADADDPFTLRFPRLPKPGEAVPGSITNAKGGIRWRVYIEREDY